MIAPRLFGRTTVHRIFGVLRKLFIAGAKRRQRSPHAVSEKVRLTQASNMMLPENMKAYISAEKVGYESTTELLLHTIAYGLFILLRWCLAGTELKSAQVRETSRKKCYPSLNQPNSILDSVLSHYSICILSPVPYEESGEVKEPLKIL